MSLAKSTSALLLVISCIFLFSSESDGQIFRRQGCKLLSAKRSCSPCLFRCKSRKIICLPPLNCRDSDGFCDCRERGGSRSYCRQYCENKQCDGCYNSHSSRVGICLPPLNCEDPDGFCDCRESGKSRRECRKYCSRRGCCPCTSDCGCQ